MNASEIRLARFLELLEQYSTAAEFAQAIGKSTAYVGHLKSGFRNIGNRTARHIEEALQLPDGYMDTPLTNESYTDVKPMPELALFNRLERQQKEALLVIMKSMVAANKT